MNDRFKFRAWHKEAREMVEVEGVYPYQDESTQCGEIFIEGFECSFYFPEECELMQCTGLKDKNGKLIYEGDIVNVSCGNFIIKYCDNCKSFQCFYKDDCFACEGDYHWFDLLEDLEKLEVIGNIYENPELLQECE